MKYHFLIKNDEVRAKESIFKIRDYNSQELVCIPNLEKNR